VLDDLHKNVKKEEEFVKKRSVSHDLTSNKVMCQCCKKIDYSILPIQDMRTQTYLCTKCRSALTKKQDYASTKGGRACISLKGPNLVEFTCHKGHSWTVNIHRGYKNWCSACIKLAKEEQKLRYKRQSCQMNKENADKQQKLFDDAKTQYLAKSQAHAACQFQNFDDLFLSVLPEAKLRAEADLNQPNVSSLCTYEQVLCVYKVLGVDAERVQFILSGMSQDSKKVGFKKLALSLHPDKNRHPLSNEAFLKASELFNSST